MLVLFFFISFIGLCVKIYSLHLPAQFGILCLRHVARTDRESTQDCLRLWEKHKHIYPRPHINTGSGPFYFSVMTSFQKKPMDVFFPYWILPTSVVLRLFDYRPKLKNLKLIIHEICCFGENE